MTDLIGFYPALVREGVFCGINLVALAKRFWALDAMRAEKPLPKLKFRASARSHSGSGRAWPWANRLVVTLSADTDLNRAVKILLHELVHVACPDREHHGELFQRRMIACAREAFGLALDTAELLDTEVEHHGKRAYAIDAKIHKAMQEAKVAERLRDDPELRFEPPPPETEEAIVERRAVARTKLVDTRAAHAREMLAAWERKEKHAHRLAAKWRTKVRYYERKKDG